MNSFKKQKYEEKEYKEINIKDLYSTFEKRKELDNVCMNFLQNSIGDNDKILDFGGGIGYAFYLAKYKDILPQNIKWTVCELENILKVGKKFAKDSNENRIEFIEGIDSNTNFNILFSSGAFQYIDKFFMEEIISKNYTYIILDRFPLSENKTFLSIQNQGGGLYVKHYIYNKNEFINILKKYGYCLIEIYEENYDCFIVNPKDKKNIKHPVKYFQLFFKKEKL